MSTLGEGQDTFEDSPAPAAPGQISLVLCQECICTVREDGNVNMGSLSGN